MPRLFKSAKEKDFAKLLSKVVYCNPFTEERLQVEASVLGKDYVTAGRDWNLDPRDERRHENMSRMHNYVVPILDGRRKAYLDGAGTPEERASYADMIILHLYTLVRNPLDETIHEASQAGQNALKTNYYSGMLEGFQHYFGDERPIQPEHLFACYFQIRRAFHNIFKFFVGTSVAATRLRARLWQSIFTYDLYRYQRSLYSRMPTIPTLITGPSGSGKEVVARAIGFSQYIPFNPKKKSFETDYTKGFYPVSLSALSPTLIESELFGHRKGAFTGALQDREGYFAACGKEGTVFLDEIGEVNTEIQIKLLRVLQTRSFQRLGDVHSESMHGKIIAATNRNLEEEIAKGRFREDFYYRLRSDVIETPSLSEMISEDPGELEFLAKYAAGKIAGELEVEELASEFIQWSREHPNYSWAGNFRELEQALRSLLVHGTYEPPRAKTSGSDSKLLDQLAATGWSLDELTRRYVKQLYKQKPVFEQIARDLDVDRRTVKKYLKS
ncbi:MAG: sigma-54-dependent transcriptional regulator [Puniceicoccaceae bacterium]